MANSRSTLSQLLTRVRAHLGENYSEEWKDTTIKEWINLAIQRIASVGDFWFMEVPSETVNAVSGTTSYELDKDVKKIARVLDVSNSNNIQEYSFVPYGEYNVDDTSDNVSGTYSYTGNDLIVKVDSATTLKVKYYQFPDRLVDDEDETIVPAEFEDAIIYFASARAREQEEEFDQAARMDQLFRSTMDIALINNDKRISKEYRSFKVVEQLY